LVAKQNAQLEIDIQKMNISMKEKKTSNNKKIKSNTFKKMLIVTSYNLQQIMNITRKKYKKVESKGQLINS